ncbi:MAG TPA: 1-acyl-sn-glycerol-3-phosphate acyltransferase [Dehalococcoidia bacterium]|nr:1-acyl-sn-glycerol-3-phosphate acyltransferase [Dehalococcoidia bacterium]
MSLPTPLHHPDAAVTDEHLQIGPHQVDLLRRLIADAANRPPAEIGCEDRLEVDCGLDSLGRVDLMLGLEASLGVAIDESRIGPETTVAEVASLIAEQRPATPATLPRWPLSRPAAALRRLLQVPAFALLDRIAPVEVAGEDVFRQVPGPCLLVANHTSHLDTPILIRSLPPDRRRVAVGAAADYFFARPLAGSLMALAANAFPIPRGGSPRATLDHCAWLFSRGWSVLLYPEGTRSVDGRIGRFRPGAGWLARELGRPVVPAHLTGVFAVLPKGCRRPHPGPVRVRFGRPLSFDRGTPATLASTAIERAVRDLAADEYPPVADTSSAGRTTGPALARRDRGPWGTLP